MLDNSRRKMIGRKSLYEWLWLGLLLLGRADATATADPESLQCLLNLQLHGAVHAPWRNLPVCLLQVKLQRAAAQPRILTTDGTDLHHRPPLLPLHWDLPVKTSVEVCENLSKTVIRKGSTMHLLQHRPCLRKSLLSREERGGKRNQIQWNISSRLK